MVAKSEINFYRKFIKAFQPGVEPVFMVKEIKKVVQVGFEPTPPKRLELESSALDRSATEPLCYLYVI